MKPGALASCGTILLAVMTTAAPRAAKTHVFTDPADDTLVESAADAYDLTSVEVSRRSSNVIRFVIPLKEELPKTPPDGSGWKVFLDIDDDATTGDTFIKGMGIDVYIVATFAAARRKWEAVTIPRIPRLQNTPFTIRHFRVRKTSVKLEILSPAFISRDQWKFVMEVWEGNRCVDRLPNEGTLRFPPGPATGR